MKVYLDNASTTMVCKESIDEMNRVMQHYGNPSSLHELGQKASQILQKSREIIAQNLGCDASEIIFTASGTESDNLAIRGAGRKHIVTSIIEHPAILNTCKDLEKQGVKVNYLKVDKQGFVNLSELDKIITPDSLVSIIHANNEIGTIQDISRIAALCRKHNALFHSDAVQSFGKIKIDIKNIDMLSISSHKLHGPKGVAALYVRVKLRPIITGGGQEFGLRSGTENVAAIAAFAKAVQLINYENNMQKLKLQLASGLLKIKGTKINGSLEQSLPNILNISFDGIDSARLLMKLNTAGIYCSSGSACSSKSHESHVLREIGADEFSSIRFSLSRYTTEEEIDYVLNVVPKTIQELRKN